jgi:hypothetical protein
VNPAWSPAYKTSAAAAHTFYNFEDVIQSKYLGEPQYTENKAENDEINLRQMEKVSYFLRLWRKWI